MVAAHRDFHVIDGKCSRNYWEDLGLQSWQLLVIALITTLFFLAVFVGCIYYVILMAIRRFRKTRPSGEPVPTESFVDKGAAEKQKSVTGKRPPHVKQAEKKHSFKKKTQRLEGTRAQLRSEMNVLMEKEEEEGDERNRGTSMVAEERRSTSVVAEERRSTSVVYEERRRGTSVVDEERRRVTSKVVEKRRGASMLVKERRGASMVDEETDDDEVPSTSIRPLTKFILPLYYSNGHGEVLSVMEWRVACYMIAVWGK
ncbi:hypothetical protein E2C01_009334 [Portunus trituberculatus]|uniref:Uncharacterized protein n=1 Tax=Portunus trituberculatus TaxID=210409 RepID=A0A5B7D499_PORTR|nr:hypothetical protein [Portunus trituberculatus]